MSLARIIQGFVSSSTIRLVSRSAQAPGLSILSPHSKRVSLKTHDSNSSSTTPPTSRSPRRMSPPTIVCIGDLHGHSMRLRRLWRNLELRLGPGFASATVIFLGDYCDRGDDTAGVLDFLISLPTRYPSQKHVFLCGNHDFGFMAFLGLLPKDPGFSFSQTWKAARPNSETEEGWFTGDGYQDMHLQGRRWAGRIKTKFNVKKNMEYRGSIFDAEPTFNSYGVQLGDREGLIKAVPESHKAFLQNLLWIYEQEGVEVRDDPSKSFSKLVAVHAGLEANKPLEKQLEILKNKDPTLPRHEYFFGRKNVWNTPEELVKDGVVMVSGHHGSLHIERHRLIIDESGGMDHLPLTAVILPSRGIVRDTDDSEESGGAERGAFQPETVAQS